MLFQHPSFHCLCLTSEPQHSAFLVIPPTGLPASCFHSSPILPPEEIIFFSPLTNTQRTDKTESTWGHYFSEGKHGGGEFDLLFQEMTIMTRRHAREGESPPTQVLQLEWKPSAKKARNSQWPSFNISYQTSREPEVNVGLLQHSFHSKNLQQTLRCPCLLWLLTHVNLIMSLFH